MTEATGESAEAVKDAIEAVPEDSSRVDLTTVEMMSAFGLTWVWTDVTPDQAQEVYKLLGEPTVTQRMGDPEVDLSTAGQVVVGTVVDESPQAGDEPVEN